MDYGKISEMLSENSVKLVTMGGKVNPYVGAGVTLLIVVLLFWLARKYKSQIHKINKKNTAKKHSNTSNDQTTIDNVQDSIEDFLEEQVDDNDEHSKVFDHLKD